MIYSDSFVWLHFPKCAGTKVERLFQEYFANDSRVIQDPLGRKNDPTVAWHDTIAKRELRNPQFELGDRVVICSFRRLLPWLESRFVFEQSRSQHLAHNSDLLLEGKFLEQNGYVNHADVYAETYLPASILNSGKVKFIRCEYFASDFKSVFAEYVHVGRIPDKKFQEKVNVTQGSLQPDIKNMLLASRELIYSRCPYWKQVEDMAYAGCPV